MKIHIDAVFNSIDGLFSEAVEVTNETIRADIMEGEANVKGPIYQYQQIYTRNTEVLRELAERRLSSYLKQHPDNSLELFVKTGIELAKLYQENLPLHKKDPKQKTYFFRLERWIEVLEEMLPQRTEAKPKKLEAPFISLFCKLINDVGIRKQFANESNEKYCKIICERFNLPYTDNVRQRYNVTAYRTKNIENLKNRLLPLIDMETQGKLLKYLDTKYPPKENLYA